MWFVCTLCSYSSKPFLDKSEMEMFYNKIMKLHEDIDEIQISIEN